MAIKIRQLFQGIRLKKTVWIVNAMLNALIFGIKATTHSENTAETKQKQKKTKFI